MTRALKISWHFLLVLAVVAPPCRARADVGLVLNSSMGTGSSWVTSAGHASIYLSRVCPESPVKVRLCRAGEQGSVLSNYSDFHEAAAYEWNIAPVSVYLYGVEDPADRPLYATPALLAALRDNYRLQRLGSLCTTDDCAENPDANWTDMVGATFLRTVYIFEVTTTQRQDEELIARLNGSANVNHYSGTANNCADFARGILNSYFPNAVHANRLNDFGMTSPKAIARSLVRYADHHPAMQLRVTRFTQLPSDIRRSDPARIGTETLFTTKKFLFPMMIMPHELILSSASYYLTGRFSAEHATRDHAADAELQALLFAGAPAPDQTELAANASWGGYRKQWRQQESLARELGIIATDADLKHAFGQLARTSVPTLDADGVPQLYVAVDQAGREAVSELALAPGGLDRHAGEPEARLRYQLQLARVRFYLHARGMDREGLPEFEQDWALLQAARSAFEDGTHAAQSQLTAHLAGQIAAPTTAPTTAQVYPAAALSAVTLPRGN